MGRVFVTFIDACSIHCFKSRHCAGRGKLEGVEIRWVSKINGAAEDDRKRAGRRR